MTSLLDGNAEASFFCDETLIGGHFGISSQFLVDLSKRIKEDSFFWLACNFSSNPNKTIIESGTTFWLNFDKRGLVVSNSSCHAENIMTFYTGKGICTEKKLGFRCFR